MRTLRVALLLAVVAGAFAIVAPGDAARADGEGRSLKADLDGFEEPPAVSSTGSGEFRAKISRDRSSFEYTLRYEDLEGTVTQAHIHVGQKGVNGGISVWLCETSTNPGPADTPDCPGPNSGEVTGMVTAAQVIGPSGQGVAPGEFEELLEAMREGVTYANVHSTRNPGGEIRGQIRRRGGD